MRKCLAEGAGTFVLVFAGTGAMVVDRVTGGGVTHVGVAITFGLVVMAMIYTVGEASGAHLNPAVTLGFLFAGRFEAKRVLPYWVSQLIGALLASLCLRFLFGAENGLGATLPRGTATQAFMLEVVLAAILMFVILGVSTGSKEVGTMAAIAIGGVVALEALFAGPICGASMNPARSLAPALVGGHLDAVWVYLTAPFLGVALAVPLWRAIHPGRVDPCAASR